MGPTASGKTAMAVALHQRLPVEIISVDSAMVYRGMDIGTAKPAPHILQQAPHRLIDICDPAESYSAGRFCHDALAAIEQARARQKIPLLVGGTGLYFRSLEQGISPLPAADPVIRARLDREAGKVGWRGMHARLAGVDPESAARIHPADTQRIQRALEVHAITGQSLSSLLAQGRNSSLPDAPKKIIIAPAGRHVMQEQVRRRFMQMIELGLVGEVRVLYERDDITASLPSMRLVGYRQVWRYLEGRVAYRKMVQQSIIATQQLAKRQMTWLRSEQRCRWFDGTSPDLLDNILKFMLE